MTDLIPPHGDLLIECGVTGDSAKQLRQEAAELIKVPVSDADLSTVYRFGDGALSPVSGPMDSIAYNRVLEELVVEHNGRRYAWTFYGPRTKIAAS